MTLEYFLNLYLIGAIVTGLGVGRARLSRFWRCTLLWPVFWVYLVALCIEMLIHDVRR